MRRSLRYLNYQEKKHPRDPQELKDWLRQRASSSEQDKLVGRRSIYRVITAVLMAIGLHLLVIVPVSLLAKRESPVAVEKSRPIVKYLPRPKAPPKEIKKKKELVEDQAPKKQVVSVAPVAPQERPEKADHLAEINQKVEHQTRSSQTSKEPKVITPRPEIILPRQPEKQSPSASTPKNLDPTRNGRAQAKRQAKPQVPSWQDLEKVQGMPFSDHLPEVEVDSDTRLNTWQWRHAAFFNRIKESVARAWDPGTQIRRQDPTGAILGKEDRLTVVTAVIDRVGKLLEIRVQKASGVVFLDEESVRAFKVAAPFLHPPEALFADRDRFSFNFGFYLNFQRGISLDFDWKPY